MTVVCVDQDQSALEALDAMLKELPQIRETFAFRDPSLALKWLENHRAELAVVDPRVPGQESLQLIRDIRQRDPDIAVVILTGDGSFAVEAFALHVSQQGAGIRRRGKFEIFTVEKFGVEFYPYNRYVLYSTTVGEDVAKNDFLEHIDWQ